MPVNADKPHIWKTDIARSVDFYNNWFIRFAPQAYRDSRIETIKQVEWAFERTENLTKINLSVLRQYPSVLQILRMATAPPIARDRLIGIAKVSPNLVKSMELRQRIPPKMTNIEVNESLEKISLTIMQLVDRDIFPWLNNSKIPTDLEVNRAAIVVSDRLCGAITDPIIRNAQEQRQLASIKKWLEQRGYSYIEVGSRLKFDLLKPGSFSFRMNVPVTQAGRSTQVNIPIDTVIMPIQSQPGAFPLLIEAKSAGDFTNTNKRRKEEAIKVSQLKNTYGSQIRFILLLSGYFDSGYLGYEAAEGIDWVWEHRIEDLANFGL